MNPRRLRWKRRWKLIMLTYLDESITFLSLSGLKLWPSQDSSAQEPFFFQAAILFFKLAPALLRETSTLRTTCRACPAGSTCPPVASCLLYHTRVAPEAVAKLFSAHSPHKKAHCAQNELSAQLRLSSFYEQHKQGIMASIIACQMARNRRRNTKAANSPKF